MTEIERCRLSYRCTQRWEVLEPLPGSVNVRFCSKCQSAVHLAQTRAELADFARQGKCVAFLQGGGMKVGMPVDDEFTTGAGDD